MNTALFAPIKRRAKTGTIANRKYRRLGDLKRVTQSSQRAANEADREVDHSDEVSRWGCDIDDARSEDQNGSITVAEDGDAAAGIYAASRLGNLPSEAFVSVTLTVDLSREQLAEVVRVLKPDGRIIRGI